MRWIIPFLALSGQALGAGLARHAELVMADSERTEFPNGVRVTYLGTNSYQFESKGHALLVDPYFSRINFSRLIFGARIQPDSARIDESLKRLSPPRVDAIVVTHGHVDHLVDAPVIMRKTGARLIASRTAVELATRAGTPGSRCDPVSPGNVRQIGPWKITVFRATHDRVFPIGVPFAGEPKGTGPPKTAADWVCGEPLCYLIETHGTRIFIDSGGTPALLPPAGIAPVDLAILGVALPDSRTRFSDTVQRLHPRFVLPSHQDNFFRPIGAGFAFGTFTDFSRVQRDDERDHLPGRLILLDYFRPWTLPPK